MPFFHIKQKRKLGSCILLMLVLLVSCSETPEMSLTDPNGIKGETAPNEAVPVSLVITEEKSLTSDLNKDIEYWEFMATPKFTMANGEKIWGSVSYWRVLNEMNTSTTGVKTSANLGKYTSGDWYFELRALNSNKHVIAVGSAQQVIRSGLENIVHITVLPDNADGTHGFSIDATSTYTGATGAKETGTETIERYGSLHVGFEVNNLDIDPSNIRIRVYRELIGKNSTISNVEEIQNISWLRRGAGEALTNWYVTADPKNYLTISGDNSAKVGEGRAYYECVINNIDAGAYIYTFQLEAQSTRGFIPIAGQGVNVTVIGGEETQIKGTLLANEYVRTALKLDDIGEIFGTINGKTYMTVNVENTAELRFQQTEQELNKSKETPVKYVWIADGNFLDGTSETLNYTCPTNSNGIPAYGIHRVTVIAIGSQGSLGMASIDVVFNPADGPGDYNDIDWSSN